MSAGVKIVHFAYVKSNIFVYDLQKKGIEVLYILCYNYSA